ncbi:hypothetical protein HDU91_002190, partial [Kappamyces sp. JEL0680]
MPATTPNSQQVALRSTSNIATEAPTALELTAQAVNTGGGIARLSLATAREATELGFSIAKMSTRMGLGIAKAAVGGLGLPTMPLDIAEFFAITGIEIGQGATNMSFKGSTEVVRVLQQFFGDSFSLEMARSVIGMVTIEMQKTGVKMGMVEMWKFFSAWVSLQKLTKEAWRNEFIFPSVSEILVPAEGGRDSKKHIWKSLIKKNPFKPKKVVADEAPLPLGGFPTDPVQLLPLLKHYVKFANGCYGERALEAMKGNGPVRNHSSEHHFYASYCGIQTSDIAYLSSIETKSDVFNSDYVPRFCLSVDHAEQAIVLAFRGTLSARDVIVDLCGESIELAIGSDPTLYAIHGGMLKVIAKVTSPDHSSGIYRRTKALLEEHPAYSLVLTGHSLGGGLAAILGVLWADPTTSATRDESGLPSRYVKVYAFACPSVMDDRLSNKCTNLILSVAIGWDWLARVSHAAVLEIRDAAIKLKEAEAAEPGII